MFYRLRPDSIFLTLTGSGEEDTTTRCSWHVLLPRLCWIAHARPSDEFMFKQFEDGAQKYLGAYSSHIPTCVSWQRSPCQAICVADLGVAEQHDTFSHAYSSPNCGKSESVRRLFAEESGVQVESETFTPVLCEHLPAAGAVAAAHLHRSFGSVFLPWLLTGELVSTISVTIPMSARVRGWGAGDDKDFIRKAT